MAPGVFKGLPDQWQSAKGTNKKRRSQLYLQYKKQKNAAKRDLEHRRKREENKDPRLREERRARNVPVTIDQKRKWDDVTDENAEQLGLSVDLERYKRQKVEEEEADRQAQLDEFEGGFEDEDDDAESIDSMLEDDDSEENEKEEHDGSRKTNGKAKVKSSDDASQARPPRHSSPVGSTTSTNLAITPDVLAAKFPSLFKPVENPKVLVTTNLQSNLHHEAQLLTWLFPNSTYIRRSAHRYSHSYSVREISQYASNRGYTTLVVLNEWEKRPSGLDIVHLPEGPMFHFSINNWIEGKKLPGHGNPTNHYPELILNNFRTPLGLLTAHLFRTLFPLNPEIQGRQVVTLHNQRDYIFVRRHRYAFRDKRETEKSIVGSDGKPMAGVGEIRAGLQELGPRFTLKLRRIDTGIQRRSGQEWEWKAGDEKSRTRFQL